MFSIEDKIEIGSFNKAMFKDILEKLGTENASDVGYTYKELHNVGILMLKIMPTPMYNNTISAGFETELTTNEISDIINDFESNKINYYSFGITREVTKPSALAGILEEKFGFMKKYGVITHIRSLDTIPEVDNTFQIKEISASDDIYFEVAKSGFHIPDEAKPDVDKMQKSFYGDACRKSFLALKNDIPITVGQLYYNDKFKTGWIGNAATVEEHQKQGGQTAMINHRLKILKELGCKKVMVETWLDETSQSSKNLQKLGFEELFITDYYLPKRN